MADPLRGTWRLQGFAVEEVGTGRRSEPFGPAPRGTMMFGSDGWMAAVLTPRDRAPPDGDAAEAMAFRQLVACAGRYRIEPPDRFVIAVDVAWYEPWVGSEQVRTFRLDGDRLEIVSAPTRLPGPDGRTVTAVATLSWRREGTHAPPAGPEPAGITTM